MIKQRLEGPTGDVDLEKIIGSKVRVTSLTMQNGFNWCENSKKLYTVSNVNFRISIDGKCYTIITLSEIPDRTFTLKDIIFIELDNGESK